jgi:undecaprenyl-diphosphatase
MLETWQAIVLGLVEGVTEYLPVSSTGHLILTESLLGLDVPRTKEALDAFSIVIQGGAILAVVGLYWRRVLQIAWGMVGREAGGLRLAGKLGIAFLPAALLGPLLEPWIKAHLFGEAPVLAALGVGGVWMIWLDRSRGAASGGAGLEIDSLSWRHALAIGVFQCAAMWPGTSRSMMSIAGGTIVGMRRSEAAEFSFLLGLPTLGAACLYELAKNLHSAAQHGTPNLFGELGLASTLLGLAVAAVSAALAVRWLVAFLTRHGLAAFGWYRLGLCLVLGARALLESSPLP